MYIIQDRIFWIYLIITLFFTIIGITFISHSNRDIVIISILYLIANTSLLFIIYYASNHLQSDNVCIIDKNSDCFNPNNRIWLFINLIYIIILILSILWACELNNDNNVKSISGILILIGALLICGLGIIRKYRDNNILLSPFWYSIIYLSIWFVLTIYVLV